MEASERKKDGKQGKHVLDLSQQTLPLNWCVGPQLPDSVVELKLTGCQLTALPESLTRLTKLKRLFAGANQLTSLGPLARMPGLQHIGLCHNHVVSLPPPAGLQCSSLLSLDLSYNIMADLGTTLVNLTALPALQSYQQTVRGWNNRKLAYLDGQRVDSGNSSSRPPTSTQQQPLPGNSFTDSSFKRTSGNNTHLEITLGPIEVIEDPFSQIKNTWMAELTAATAAGVPPVFTTTAPLQPCYYHVEFNGCDGPRPPDANCLNRQTTTQLCKPTPPPSQLLPTDVGPQGAAGEVNDLSATSTTTNATSTSFLIPAFIPDPVTVAKELADQLAGTATSYCSVPLKLLPPTPPQAQPIEPSTPQAKGKKGKPAAAAAKTGSKPSTPLAAAQQDIEVQTRQGCLKALVPLPANLQARDWLQEDGMIQTEAKPATPPPAAKGAKAGKLGGKGKVEEEAPPVPDMSAWNIEVDTRPIAEGLWDDKGMRMPLKDLRHGKRPVAGLPIELILHAMGPDARQEDDMSL